MPTDFTLTAHEAIEKGIRLSGGNPSQAEELQSAIVTLNLLQQEWSTRGINLWKLEPCSISLPVSTPSVTLDNSYIDIVSAVIRSTEPSTGVKRDYQIERIGYKDYINYLNKEQSSRPYQFVVERLKEAPRVTFWPVPNNDTYSLQAWAIKKFDDVTQSGSVDVPSKYLPALTYGLGYHMALERSTGSAEWMNKTAQLKQEYENMWSMAFGEDIERGTLKLVPKLR